MPLKNKNIADLSAYRGEREVQMNKVTLIGRLTAEVETKTYGKGKNKGTYANFCLACPRPKKQDEDEVTDFIYCTVFNRIADFLEEYAKKGGRVAIDGTLQSHPYTTKDGEQRTSYQVLVNRVEIIDWADKND